jgi:hypothetical protein
MSRSTSRFALHTEEVFMTRATLLLVFSVLMTSGWLYLASSLSLVETVWSLFLSRVGTPIVLLLAGKCVQAARTS